MGRAAELRNQILAKLPEGTVIPRHTEKAHFYEVPRVARTYPSVTGKLQILKDEGLINYKMARALEYVSVHREEMVSPERAMQILEEASQESDKVLRDAGDIGTIIHDAREAYFKQWIETGARPEGDLKRFIRPGVTDRRAISGLRGVERFAIEQKYQPIISELYLYDEAWETAGALDDIGLMGEVVVDGIEGCEHRNMVDIGNGISRCSGVPQTPENPDDIDSGCQMEVKETIVLLDLKSSNRFKDHYFFQVAMYWHMFVKLTGVVPERVLILKVSKEDGTYKLEEMTDLPKLVEYAGHMIKTNEALAFIGGQRKDNQRNVITV